MNNTRLCDIKLLRRRRDFLSQRIENNGDADTGSSYDKAEYGALARVIKDWEEEHGKETEIQD